MALHPLRCNSICGILVNTNYEAPHHVIVSSILLYFLFLGWNFVLICEY
jgi:hypothetical protein